MSSPAVRAAIRARLAEAFSAVPLLETLNVQAEPGFSPWVSLEFLAGTEEPSEFGSPGANTYRETGTVQAHVFVPSGTGDTEAVQWADDIRKVFRGQTFGGVRVEGVDPPATGPGSEDGSWFRATISFDYDYDAQE